MEAHYHPTTYQQDGTGQCQGILSYNHEYVTTVHASSPRNSNVEDIPAPEPRMAKDASMAWAYEEGNLPELSDGSYDYRDVNSGPEDYYGWNRFGSVQNHGWSHAIIIEETEGVISEYISRRSWQPHFFWVAASIL